MQAAEGVREAVRFGLESHSVTSDQEEDRVAGLNVQQFTHFLGNDHLVFSADLGCDCSHVK